MHATIAGLSWLDACFDGCCNPCAFGVMGPLLCFLGCNVCAAMAMKRHQRVREGAMFAYTGSSTHEQQQPGCCSGKLQLCRHVLRL